MKHKIFNFTLVELLLVITIIAILAGISIPVISSISNKGRETQARADMNAIKLGLTQFKADYSVWPVAAPASGGDRLMMAAFTSGESGDDDTAMDNMMQELTKIQYTPKINADKTKTPQDVLSFTYNTKKRKYLDAPAKPVSLFGNGTEGFYKLDPWGRRYNIALDTDYNNKLILTSAFIRGDADETIAGNIAIFSYGSAEAADDTDAFLYSWKTIEKN